MRMRRREIPLYAVVAAGILLALCYRPMRVIGVLTACLGVLVLVLCRLRRTESRAARLARRTLLLLTACGLFLFAALEIYVVTHDGTDAERMPDAVVILGAGVNGKTPSLSLRVRLDAALAYVADKPDVPIVVTGGRGGGEDVTEAACMAAYLTERGIAPERILQEQKAMNTRENIDLSLQILRENGYDTERAVAFVTADYHLARTKVLYGGDGFIPVAATMPAKYFPLTVNYYLREAFGLLRAILFHR